ncbi:MAG: polyprenyl synthetase family protein [Flavobacteriales bacterium]|nr:polyprenyl synthetase family protein [Flavobacteriales bacterium]
MPDTSPISDWQKEIAIACEQYQPGVEPAGLYEPIRYILGLGGKRLRPVLVLAACDLMGGNPYDAIAPALGIELFHNFTLMHDDIMDQAPLRRNKATVHARWNINTAILSGDAMLVKAYQQFEACAPEVYGNVMKLFSKTALEVCEGQQLDMDFEAREDVALDEYMHMILMKTAVLLAASLKIGAYVADASERDADALYEFGLYNGLAFQLMDDWLDVFGDSGEVGKQVGGDILANKKTWFWLSVLKHGTEEQKALLKKWSAIHDQPDEKVAVIRDLFLSLSLDQMGLSEMKRYHQKAFQSLDSVSVPDERKEPMRSYFSALLSRTK